MNDVHILSVLLFWRHDIISTFWVDLYERLKDNQKAMESFSAPENKSLIGIPNVKNNKTGWLEKLGYPVADYLTLIDKISGFKPLNTNSVFQLLKAFRNLVSHKSGCNSVDMTLEERQQHAKTTAAAVVTAATSVTVEALALEADPLKTSFEEATIEAALLKAIAIEAAEALEETEAEITHFNQLKEKIDETFKNGMVKFWLENFPEFSLITCRAGYNVNLCLNQVDMQNVPLSSMPQYISLSKTIRKKTLHINLHQYSELLTNWIRLETENGRTGRL